MLRDKRITYNDIKKFPREVQESFFNRLSPEVLASLVGDWEFWGRPEQTFWLTDNNYLSIMYLTGRGWGKHFVNSTRIPEEGGWKEISELEVGDRVFDESGRLTYVTEVFPNQPKEKQYRVSFSDDTYLIAGESHEWCTWTHRDRKQFLRNAERDGYDSRFFPEEWPAWQGPDHFTDRHGNKRYFEPYGPKIRTTKDIIATFKQKTKRQDLNHCIPIALPLICDPVKTEIDPWLLGYWLGNGTAKSPEICGGSYKGDMDFPFISSKIFEAGYFERRAIFAEKGISLHYLGKDFLYRLQKEDVFDNKHIPKKFLRGDIDQRLALLRGLMDSDGYYGDNNAVEFCSINKVLVDGALELIRTLGERPVLYSGRAILDGVDYGEKYRVRWRPTLFNPFSLARKADKFVPPGSQALRLRHRMIVDVEEVPWEEATCIKVDSPHSLFLAGDGFIPTHNTRTGAEWLRHKIRVRYGEHMIILAPTTSDLRETVIEGESGLLKVCEEFSPLYNKSKMTLQFDNGIKVRAISMEEPDRIRGPNTVCAWVDELCAAPKAQEALDMVLFANRIPGNGGPPQLLITTTPKAIPAIIDLVKESEEDAIQHRYINGAIFDNKENLSKAILDKVEELKGTRLYEQEALGKLIDLGELGIVKKSWIKMWPKKQPLAELKYLICSYDTAYSVKNVDKKALENDPSACTIWGVCRGPDSSGTYGRGAMVAVLLDAWEDWFPFPDLRDAIKRDAESRFGPADRKPDLLLIEKKSSGQSILQELEREGLSCYPYQPGKDDKLTRLHSITPLFSSGKIYIPESNKRNGEFMSWAQPVIDQLTMFPHVKHDDLCDTVTQALAWLRDSGILAAQPPRFRETISGEMIEINPAEDLPNGVIRLKRKVSNPYAQ